MNTITISFSGYLEFNGDDLSLLRFIKLDEEGNMTTINGVEYVKLPKVERDLFILNSFVSSYIESSDSNLDLNIEVE